MSHIAKPGKKSSSLTLLNKDSKQSKLSLFILDSSISSELFYIESSVIRSLLLQEKTTVVTRIREVDLKQVYRIFRKVVLIRCSKRRKAKLNKLYYVITNIIVIIAVKIISTSISINNTIPPPPIPPIRITNLSTTYNSSQITTNTLTLVSPAIGATLQTFFDRNVLMIELLPTLGYPIQPILETLNA